MRLGKVTSQKDQCLKNETYVSRSLLNELVSKCELRLEKHYIQYLGQVFKSKQYYVKIDEEEPKWIKEIELRKFLLCAEYDYGKN